MSWRIQQQSSRRSSRKLPRRVLRACMVPPQDSEAAVGGSEPSLHSPLILSFVPRRMELNVSVSHSRAHGHDNSLIPCRSTRVTTAIPKLQRVLIKGLQAGITLPVPTDSGDATSDVAAAIGNRSVGYGQDLQALNASSLIMPEEWVKGGWLNALSLRNACSRARVQVPL